MNGTHSPPHREDDLIGLEGKKRASRKQAKRNKRTAKKAKRKQQRRKVWGFLKRFNPALSAMRNGVYAAMKMNLKQSASRLRYGYLSPQEAQTLGVDLNKHTKIKKTLSKLERTIEKLGGRKRNLKKAILKGRGNKDRKVPLQGVVPYFFDEEETLGEIAAATVIAAATPIVLATINMMAKSGVANESDMYDSSQTDYDPDEEELPNGEE